MAQDGKVLHVFDLATRRELKRMVLTTGSVLDVQLLPAQGQLLVHLNETNAEGNSRQVLRMYGYR